LNEANSTLYRNSGVEGQARLRNIYVIPYTNAEASQDGEQPQNIFTALASSGGMGQNKHLN